MQMSHDGIFVRHWLVRRGFLWLLGSSIWKSMATVRIVRSFQDMKMDIRRTIINEICGKLFFILCFLIVIYVEFYLFCN